MDVLIRDAFLSYDSRTKVLLLRNSLRYQAPDSNNVIVGAVRRICSLPNTPLLKEFIALARIHCCREGAPHLAPAFYAALEHTFAPGPERPFERPSEPSLRRPSELLNLPLRSSTSNSILKPETGGGGEDARARVSGISPRGDPDKEPEPIRTPLPEDLALTDEMRSYAKKHHFEIELEFDNFKVRARTRDLHYADWEAALWDWLTKGSKYGKKTGGFVEY